MRIEDLFKNGNGLFDPSFIYLNIFNYAILCSNKALATCCLLLNPHVVL